MTRAVSDFDPSALKVLPGLVASGVGKGAVKIGKGLAGVDARTLTSDAMSCCPGALDRGSSSAEAGHRQQILEREKMLLDSATMPTRG